MLVGRCYNADYLHFNGFIDDRSETDQVFFYLAGLKSEIYREVMLPGMPAKLEEAMQRAHLADMNYLRRKAQERWQQPRQPGNGNGHRASGLAQPMELGNVFHILSDSDSERSEEPGPATTSDPAAAEDVVAAVVNALKAFKPNSSGARPAAKSRMTEAERERCRTAGLCFYCQKPGHRASECPKLKGRPQQSSGPKNCVVRQHRACVGPPPRSLTRPGAPGLLCQL